MKITLIFVVLAICSQTSTILCNVTPGLPPTVSTTTRKPWTHKLKDGLNTFFQGAAIVGAVQNGIQNSRSNKHKQTHVTHKP
ncbi:unnamed protein product [Parnassius mnemosyne]|uniref:Uncharacterized protein n=1 Tax=Parnassius mnemosyne TaxID=213953 RepID=A0AAV1KUE6_9NEOP